jgi:RHS repeat-associated protein
LFLHIYDANGNLTNDAKKGTTITYNELNKPTIIVQNNTFDRVVFEYDAAGVRVSKTVIISGTSTKEYYIGGLVVQSNNTVKYFAMAEGRVRNNSGTLTFEYFITDQQGNTRVSFEDNGSGTAVVRQENSYYAFGMPMAGNYMPTDANKKLYNAGNEWQDEFSGLIDYYSTFFREYDPVIGRFNGVDPKAEITDELSIYHYSGNNPVNFNDPMGDVDAPNYMNVWDNIYRTLMSSAFGGSWNPVSGLKFFTDESDAMEGFKSSVRALYGDRGDYGTGDDGFQRIWNHLTNNLEAGNKLLGIRFGDNKHHGWGATIAFSGYTDKGEFALKSSFLAFPNTSAETKDWAEKANIFSGAFATSWGAKAQLIDLMVREQPALKSLGYVKFIEGASKRLFVLQIAVSGYQIYAVLNSNASFQTKVTTTAKSVTDIGAAYLILAGGPPGWAAGGLYFLGDITGFNSWLINNFSISDEQTKQIWKEINEGKRPCPVCDR